MQNVIHHQLHVGRLVAIERLLFRVRSNILATRTIIDRLRHAHGLSSLLGGGQKAELFRRLPQIRYTVVILRRRRDILDLVSQRGAILLHSAPPLRINNSITLAEYVNVRVSDSGTWGDRSGRPPAHPRMVHPLPDLLESLLQSGLHPKAILGRRGTCHGHTKYVASES